MAIVRRQLVAALVAFLVLTLLTGVAYPLAVTGIAQVVFPGRADGSLVERDGVVVPFLGIFAIDLVVRLVPGIG